LFVAKVVPSETPTFVLTSSIHVALALANTSAVPSDSIWPASPSEGPKLKATVVPGWAVWKSAPIFVKAPVRDEAAKTVRVVSAADRPEPGADVELEEEHAVVPSTSVRMRSDKRRTTDPFASEG
jgi:hypothetical protein